MASRFESGSVSKGTGGGMVDTLDKIRITSYTLEGWRSWFNAAVLKTADRDERSKGSNPLPSSSKILNL